MAISSFELIGYMRAEFAKASSRRLWLIVAQLLISVPAALSVVITDETYVYLLAVAATILLIGWWWIRSGYRRVRAAAHTARRACLIQEGLGTDYSPEEHQRLRTQFTVDERTALLGAKDHYYATDAAPGPQRLGEMLEESAFYSCAIHRASSHVMGVLFILFLGIAVLTALLALPYVERNVAITWVRILLAVLVFMLSSDVLGAAQEHHDAAAGAESVRSRMAAAHAKGFPEADVMLAMADYNSAMEGAPEAVPGVYPSIQERLNRRWNEYKADRVAARNRAGQTG